MGRSDLVEVRRFRRFLGFAAIVTTAFTARASLADHYRVPSGSMEPTVHVGDHIVAWKAAYGLRLPLTEHYLAHFHAPARGDVVVLEPPSAPADGVASPVDGELLGSVLLKRVVAVEGDLVEVKRGRLFIDGQFVEEEHASLASGGGPDFGPVRVPRGQLLVLGDNRGNSRDGRSFGWVARDQVLGRAAAVVTREGHLTYEPL